MEPIPLAIVAMGVALVIGRVGGLRWVIQRYQAGKMTARRAKWLISIGTIVPYVLLLLIMLVSDPGFWWLALLVFIASWPVIALPLIAVIYTIKNPRQP
jgi:ABC-type dipeptide/oligopeptide/nickel transport system permease subunit